MADVNLNRGKQIAAKAKGKTDVYQNYRKILERKDVDAIVTERGIARAPYVESLRALFEGS